MSQQLLDGPVKSRKPKNSPFFQQKLPAWQPLFTARKSGIMFLVIGLIFMPFGVLLLITTNNVVEYVVDYTECMQINSTNKCADINKPGLSCLCMERIQLNSFVPGPVFIYYGLRNFYQNHRRYGRSKNDDQLLGIPMSPSSLSSCDPYSSYNNGTSYAILPCGAVANSIFNDTFQLAYEPSASNTVEIKTTSTGVAWSTDKDRKYGKLTVEALSGTVKPLNWPEPVSFGSGAFKTSEDLMVWMRISTLPNFRKLHRFIIHDPNGEFKNGLPAGNYSITINYNYPVTSFGGRKSFILANASWLGGKNSTLGITCLITGSLHIFLGVAFLVVHFVYGKRKALRSPPVFF